MLRVSLALAYALSRSFAPSKCLSSQAPVSSESKNNNAAALQSHSHPHSQPASTAAAVNKAPRVPQSWLGGPFSTAATPAGAPPTSKSAPAAGPASGLGASAKTSVKNEDPLASSLSQVSFDRMQGSLNQVMRHEVIEN